MISESEFTRNHYLQLADLPAGAVVAEMGAIRQWIARDTRDPKLIDALFVVYIRPIEDGTIATACSCVDGAADRPCLHALRVITEIKDQAHLLLELFKKPDSVVAA